MRKALIIQGGWDGHEPVQVSELFRKILEKENFEVEISDTLEVLNDKEYVNSLDLFIPVWTMGKIENQQVENVMEAVGKRGLGVAGCHGGMCDAFRESVAWQFMTGGNWVSHPGGDGIEYKVNIKNCTSPIVDGIKNFDVKSEHYYLHVDPAVEVLATTQFPIVHWYHSANGVVDMPVVWTKKWGHGRIFYNALGHKSNIIEIPEVTELMRRGFLWAAEGKERVIKEGLDPNMFENSCTMY